MKRKVIKQGHKTLTLTLPSKWCEKNNIKPGTEVDVDESKSMLIISRQDPSTNLKAKLDISNIDRTSVLYTIRNLFRLGYDELELTYGNIETKNYRTGDKQKIEEVVRTELNNLVGYEVINQGSHFIKIKDISTPHKDEFENLLRRIFLLLNECGKDFKEGMRNRNEDIMRSIQLKHDIITKFISSCLRLLTKFNYNNCKNESLLYHIIATLDKIADGYKILARFALAIPYEKPNDKFFKEFDVVTDSVEKFMHLYYKFDINLMAELNQTRSKFRKRLETEIGKYKPFELYMLQDGKFIIETLAEVIVTRMGLHDSDKLLE